MFLIPFVPEMPVCNAGLLCLLLWCNDKVHQRRGKSQGAVNPQHDKTLHPAPVRGMCIQVLTGEVTRLTAALAQAQREANAAGQARAEVDDLSTQVWHSLLSVAAFCRLDFAAACSMPSGVYSSVQQTPSKAAFCLLMSQSVADTRLCSLSHRFNHSVIACCHD